MADIETVSLVSVIPAGVLSDNYSQYGSKTPLNLVIFCSCCVLETYYVTVFEDNQEEYINGFLLCN